MNATPRYRRCSRTSRGFIERWLPRFERRTAQLSHRRHRLHRRPAPLGVPDRTPGRALCRPGHHAPRSATGNCA
ncbi:MAG: hypothetical protein MZW92_09650 [Comamonadaceae bacterium]|nr:hypothetical protein [Comamonadaceae bacterium]